MGKYILKYKAKGLLNVLTCLRGESKDICTTWRAIGLNVFREIVQRQFNVLNAATGTFNDGSERERGPFELLAAAV
jgi:hypothetical protein